MAGQDDCLVVRLVHAADQLGQHLAAGDACRGPESSLRLQTAPPRMSSHCAFTVFGAVTSCAPIQGIHGNVGTYCAASIWP